MSSLAYLLSCDVEGDAGGPHAGGAVASETGPGLPQVAGDFLVEVADAVAAAVGEAEAHSHQRALALAEHVQKLSILACVGLHCGEIR